MFLDLPGLIPSPNRPSESGFYCSNLKISPLPEILTLVSALGVLLGKQTGRDIEIISSFDVCYDVMDNSWILNRDYLDSRLEQGIIFISFPP